MVNRLKVGGKYPGRCQCFKHLHEYDNLKQGYIIFILEAGII